MSDEFDVAVHDAVALAEIELLTNLIIATSERSGRLTQAEIDAILGVVSAAESQDPQSGRPPSAPPDGS